MPRKVLRSKRAQRPILFDSLRQYLETGCYLTRETFPLCPGRIRTFQLANPRKRDELKKVWLQHREQIMSEWKRNKRKGLPWAERKFDV